jgi:hypothetical protein
VKALVYVAALQPDVGETSAEVASLPPASNDLKPTKTSVRARFRGAVSPTDSRIVVGV